VQLDNTVEFVSNSTGYCFGHPPRAADRADQVELAEHVRQSRKLEELGRLASSVAHDFNNLLTVIGGNADLLLDGLDPQDVRRVNVEQIRQAAQRAASLTRQLLAFSRRRASANERLDLNGLVEGLGNMLRLLIGENVELVIGNRPRPAPILADAGQVEQVIFNLVVNASDAMPNGGRIAIETSECEVALGDETVAVPPGRYVTLSVIDNGSGMDEETQRRIFEPFFTTKAAGKGTGLGLATVREIVRECGGGIEVSSCVGHGSRFRAYFPRAESGEALSCKVAPSPGAKHGDETILVAEDDENVRALAQRLLQSLGYHVLSASSGEEACQISERHSGPIHLLLADVVMPRLNGPDLGVLLRARRPELKLLLMSGYRRDAIARHGGNGREIAFVQKPFTPEALAAAIRLVLDGCENECLPRPTSTVCEIAARPAEVSSIDGAAPAIQF
jgi:two-component system, cell cycle sensor histidine kinase and response regulator CckA